jgi:hypothetical protein
MHHVHVSLCEAAMIQLSRGSSLVSCCLEHRVGVDKLKLGDAAYVNNLKLSTDHHLHQTFRKQRPRPRQDAI